ncbi:MAG: NAD(P)H-dependent oxidoreductase [Betaproteobacteria bacterium]|nr:NAD(P)H-dependent oxidoreductase [Betaproteobacteria bacterium]MDH5221544.1 NAD(P)H-dependent oxidoreductase [Betaproteobacteria bacterium]MDH5350928.1 NAD(P)H-dependent oxidoreductase [Betaproteobacteria bacterium]
MSAKAQWQDLGPAKAFQEAGLSEASLGRQKIAVSWRDGRFGAVAGTCNHAGGPLGKGRLEGDYVVCPWHHWKFHRCTGEGEPGFEEDKVPAYELRVQDGRLEVRTDNPTRRHKKPHEPHPLARKIERAPGAIRVAGISTTNMDEAHPRYSTSDALLQVALEHAGAALQCQTQLIRLSALKFRNCEGYYSKSAHACTWPCSITQMDAADELTAVYEALVHWADVVLVSTPIRWGVASALYFKMAERLNCIQNQVTIRDSVLIRRKVAAFVITGGQDNVQGVAGEMLCFFSELGFHFPQFPYIAHSRGWSAEDMERNVEHVMRSAELREGARMLAERAVGLAKNLLATAPMVEHTPRGGRKAYRLEIERA